MRQTRLDGTPVVETRVRIPGGDAVQRVYSVADAGGLTVIEVTNDSSLPIAVAFSGGNLLSRRPPTAMPIQGIDLPSDAVVHPIGHRSTLTVARAHSAAAGAALPEVSSAEQVANGWLTQTQRASRLQLPDSSMVEAVTAARCELLLDGPVPDDGGEGDTGDTGDSSEFLLAVAELVRMTGHPTIWVPDVAAHLERLARSGTQMVAGVVEATARVLHAAGEDRAVADLRKMKFAEPMGNVAVLPSTAALVPVWVERRLGHLRRARGTADAAVVSAGLAGRRLRSPRPADRVGVDPVVRDPLARRASGVPVGDRRPADAAELRRLVDR